jgi:WD40 repeat protein
MNKIDIEDTSSTSNNNETISCFQKNKKLILIIVGASIAVILLTLAIVLPIVLTSSSSSSHNGTTTTNTTIIILGTSSTQEVVIIEFGEVIQEFEGHQSIVGKVIELANERLASISYDGTIRIWNRTTSLSENTINQAGFLLLISLQSGNLVAPRMLPPLYNIEIFSPTTGENILTLLTGYTYFVTGIY